jgi:hypothetical protein
MKKFDKIVIGLAIVTALYGIAFYFIGCDKPNPEINECQTWALGSDWQSVETRDIPARWNELHGDLFKLHIDDDLSEGNNRIYEAWRKHKLK